MSISKSHPKKSPSRNPVDFALLKSGGKGSVPDKLSGPKPRELIYGKKSLK
jgi:hypothetical protein